jgi:hypothetical protein
MRKNILTLILLLYFLSNSFGQTKNSLHVGFHYFNLEDEKFALDFVNIGYQKDFAKRFNWDSSLGFIAYSRENKKPAIVYSGVIINDPNAYFNDFNNTSIISFNSRLGYAFIKSEKMKIGLGLGISTVYAVESRYSVGSSFFDPNTNFISYTSYATYSKAFDIGWTPKLFIERKINNKFSVEGAAEIYFHLRNKVAYIYALGFRVNYYLGINHSKKEGRPKR